MFPHKSGGGGFLREERGPHPMGVFFQHPGTTSIVRYYSLVYIHTYLLLCISVQDSLSLISTRVIDPLFNYYPMAVLSLVVVVVVVVVAVK